MFKMLGLGEVEARYYHRLLSNTYSTFHGLCQNGRLKGFSGDEKCHQNFRTLVSVVSTILLQVGLNNLYEKKNAT